MRRLRLFFLFLAGLLAGGCWDYRDINERSLVLGWAFDLGPGEERIITAEASVPAAAGGGGPAAGGATAGGGGGPGGGRAILEGRAPTAPNALSDLRENWPRPLSFGHLVSLVVGQEYAREGEKDAYGCFGCHPEASVATQLIVTGGKAGDAFRINPRTENFAAADLASLVRNALPRGTIPHTHSVYQFVAQMEDTGVSLLPWLELSENNVKLAGSGVFRDYRLVGRLNEEETLGLNLLQGKARRGAFDLRCAPPGGRGAPGQTEATFLIMSKGSRKHLSVVDGRPSYRYKLTLAGIVFDAGCPSVGVKRGAAEDLWLRREVASRAQKLALATVHRAQAMGMDFIGLSEDLRRRKPGLWRELKPRWAEEFPRIPVEVEVRIKLQRRAAFHAPTEEK